MKQYSNVTSQAQFGGSVKMVKQVTELHQIADIVAVADYSVIPQYLFGGNGATNYTDWYVGFATNAVTFVYTEKSKFGEEITAQNWYQVLSRPGVQIGRSNPDTDPSGYQAVQMLTLAEKYYNRHGLVSAILANAPKTNMRDTETELIAALESGQIDYLAIYRSDARQHHFKYLRLLAQIDLSDAKYASLYTQASVQTANGTLAGKPIVYAVTIPNNAANPE
jgi:molybdate/tungstate transport system substrate-binding protein